MKRTCFLILMVLWVQVGLTQQKQLVIGLELRPRLLLDDGYKNPKANDDPVLAYITQRTRLNASYQQQQFEAYFSLQDVRVWGGDNQYSSSGIFGNTGSLSLHQGWFILKPIKTLSIKTGRQLFQYDDQRIISSRNWNDYQITYDAVLIQFDNAKDKIDIGLTWNSETINTFLYPQVKFKIFDFIRYERIFRDFNISAIALITGNTVSDTVSSIYLKGTYGLNLLLDITNLHARITGYFQNNLNQNGTRLHAFCFSLLAQYDVFQKRASFSIGVDYLSGQDETKTSNKYNRTNHRFDILYGRRHGWYGYIDFFPPIPEQGLQDYYLKADYRPWKKLTLQLDGHFFWLASNKYNVDGSGDILKKNLGQELDFTLIWKIMDVVSLQGGYSFYLMTETLRQVKGVNNTSTRFPQFAYIMITAKPELFCLGKK